MKKIIIIPMFCLSLIGYSQSIKTKVEEGTIILLKSLSIISSNTTMDGESIDFFCAENLVVNNKLIIKKNSKITGKVESSEKSRSLGKGGSLKIIFNYITAIDGQNIPISGVYNYVKGDNKSGTAIGLSLVLSPFFLFLKGKEANIPIGSLIEVYTTQEIEIQAQ
jgi:hypothetical protein